MGDDWPRPIVHVELRAKDPVAQRAFYRELFSWDVEEGGLHSFAAGPGGPEPGPAGHIGRSDSPGVTLYVQVRDLAESQAKAAALGGAATFPPFDVPGGPSLAGITDPEGNPLVLVQQ